MDEQITSRLAADLFLLPAPSVHDFRERDDMLLAYLSDSVNVTSVCEMYPIGWFSIKRRLADCGFDAKIVNVASLMLMHPDLDVRRLRPIDGVTPRVMKRGVRESLRRGRNRLDRANLERWSIDSATDRADILHALSDLAALDHARSTIIGKEVHRDELRDKADVSFLPAAWSASVDRGGACIYLLTVSASSNRWHAGLRRQEGSVSAH